MHTRRDLLKTTVVAGAGLATYGIWRPRRAWAFYQTGATPLWKTALRGVGVDQIPVAAPDPFAAPVTSVTHYTMDINEFTDAGVNPFVGPTKLWGYNPAVPLFPGAQKHLGGIIVAQKGVPIQLTFRNNLPARHIIPVDATIMGAELAQNRVVTHLHGGLVPWISDGGPFAWFAPDGSKGPSFMNNQVLNPAAAANEAEFYYPMNQSARFLWYHDHALGITRVNAYAGIASGLLLRDAFEGDLRNQGLPKHRGRRLRVAHHRAGQDLRRAGHQHGRPHLEGHRGAHQRR